MKNRQKNQQMKAVKNDVVSLVAGLFWRCFGNSVPPSLDGAPGRGRTSYTEIFSLLLYQLSYRGVFTRLIKKRLLDLNQLHIV